MLSCGDVFRLITGLRLKSNWYKRSIFVLSSILAVAIFFAGYTSEGEDIDVAWKNKLMNAVLILVGINTVINTLGNLLDPKDDEAPLLPIFRRPQDAIYDPDQDIRNQQLIVASVLMANVNVERRVNELALENQMLRRWANY